MKELLLLAAVLAGCGGGKSSSSGTTPTGDDVTVRNDGEEEPDDGLEVQSTRGKMDRAAIEAGIEPHAQALQDCYLSRVGKQRWLGGKVELKWEISKDGALISAQLVTSDLGAWPVEKCMLDIARSMTFAKPKGGDADFTVPFEFTAHGYAMWWEADMAQNVVGKHIGDLAGCAKVAKVPDPTDVTVTLYVGTRGKVQSAGFSSPALIEDGWADCAHKKVTAWTLTDPKGKVAKLAFVYREGQTPQPEEEW